MSAKKKPGFKRGDIVTWESQAKGNVTVKTGRICAVIRPGMNAWACAEKVAGPDDRLTFQDGERDHQSYIVRVGPTGNGKMTKLYWPRVKYLKKAR